MLLKARDLSCRRGERTLFAGLDFELAPRSFLAIEGRSGIGKTSLLSILSGAEKPASGSVELAASWAEIPQLLALNEELTALENACVGAMAGAPWWRSLTGPAAETVIQAERSLRERGIVEPRQILHRLSGGERQRVAAVRVSLQDWRILFADEPVSQLDDRTAREILTFLRDEAEKREGSIVCVLHQRHLIEEFATARMSLDEGNPR